jgi:hypothetical protein
MTQVLQPRELWNAMPGWGITANLLPPEVTEARQVRAIRRLVVLTLLGVLCLGVVGYGFAMLRSHSAQVALNKEQSRTTQLQVEQRKYDGVTQIQGTVSQVKAQVATLLKNDVDFPNLVAQLRAQLPPAMTISALTVTLTAGGSQSTAVVTAPLDSSGHTHIGTITISGDGRHLTDISTYVERLSTIKGIAQPYPTSNRTADTGVQYSVQVTINDQLLTHRYDTQTGGK